jgi:light-regulated signal transduction histidine kinase (bacteriophytochrome)
LNVIDARAEQLLSRPDSPPETRQRNLTIIRAQTESITRIVRQLLDLARPFNLRREPVDLAALLDDTRELIEADAARNGIWIEIAAGDRVEVDADSGFLQQVLLNICGNSIQAMQRGGRLRIECLRDRAAENGRRFAAVQVSDTGDGIAPEHLPHIFEPFFTTKDVGSGTGLGLTVSRRIIDGAFQYLTKPFEIDELLRTVEQALEHSAPQRERAQLRREMPAAPARIIGASRPMREMFDLIARGAQREHRFDHRRIRHRKGIGRARHPRHVGSQGRVRSGQLRRDPG